MNWRSRTTSVTFFAVILFLSGCASLGPDYQRPSFELPDSVSETSEKNDALASSWNWVNDPVLDNFLNEAARKNQDLALAAGRVEEVLAQAKIADASRYPTIDASLGAVRFPTQNSAIDGVQIRSNSDSGQNWGYQLGLTASYEIDFWGKLKDANQAARARLLAQEANRGIVQSSLYMSVVQTYFELRAFDARLSLAESIRKTRQDYVTLQQARTAAGDIDVLALHQAQLDLAAADMTLAQARQAVANTESAMAVLLGRSPDAISAPHIARGADIDALYANQGVPPEFPSDLLNRRPDIIAAEQALIAAHADIGQAKAAYFPSVKLGAALTSAGDLSNPTSMLWNVGASVVQSIFHGGSLDAGVTVAEARHRQALALYLQSVQNAFRDVHDSLTNLNENQQIYSAANARVLILKDSLRLVTIRYEYGYGSYQSLLDAQNNLMKMQMALIDTQRAHLTSRVNLFKAVGCGWELRPKQDHRAVMRITKPMVGFNEGGIRLPKICLGFANATEPLSRTS